MITSIGAWLRSILGAGLISALCLAVCPPGRVRRTLRIACGAAVAAALLSPVLSFDTDAYSLALAQYRELAYNNAASAEDAAKRLNRRLIERDCAAYILSKAEALDMTVCDVSVHAEWSGDWWLPYSCALRASERSEALAAGIEAELGIPIERQSWEVSE